jgi:integrase
MPRLNLTERSIAKLAAPDPSGQQIYHWDTGLRGFGVLCSGTSNLKTYVVQREVHGKARRVKVAAVAELSLAKARDRAREMLDDMRRGIDPSKRSDRNMTLQTALDSYLASATLRAASVRAYKIIERTLADWLNIPLRDITRDMVEKKHREIGAKTASTANLSFRSFRVMWNHAAGKISDLPTCPTSALRKNWFEEKRRQRMVTSDQLLDFHQAVMALPNAIMRDAIRVCMFTGMRRGECTSLRWQDVDFNERLIRLPAEVTKANKDFELPMNDVTLDLLVARRAIGKDRFVFPGTGKSGHISYLQDAFEDIAESTGITVSAHDLRRGFATTANRIGTPLPIIKQLLNHAESKDVTEGYIIPDLKELREASQKIADELKRLCGFEEPASKNVTKLRKGEVAVS